MNDSSLASPGTPDTPTLVLEAVLATFAAAEGCWFATARPDGRPHSIPIWFVWHAGTPWFSASARSVHARNVGANPSVQLNLPDIHSVILIEGTAFLHAIDAPIVVAEIGALYTAKYQLDILAESRKGASLFIQVVPSKVLTWGAQGNGRWLAQNGAWQQDNSFNPFA